MGVYVFVYVGVHECVDRVERAVCRSLNCVLNANLNHTQLKDQPM